MGSIIDEDKIIVAEWIVFRTKKRWTIRHAAMVIKVDPTLLSRVEKNKRKPSDEVKGKMALAMITRSHVFMS